MNEATKSDRSDKSDNSDGQHAPRAPERLLPPHGGYRKLRSFQVAEAVYDSTVVFCDRFVEKRSRTHDQMVQAARSGRQNIAEGSMASATSKKTELKLTNVAKASLEELLLDYEDFLRQRGLPLWGKDSREATAVRILYQADGSSGTDPHGIGAATAEVAANTLICLINQAIYLLKRQLERLERDFVEQGGFTERLYIVRSAHKSQEQMRPAAPDCPRCGKPMVLRTARQGANAGKSFWGCAAYPDCTGTRPVEREDGSD